MNKELLVSPTIQKYKEQVMRVLEFSLPNLTKNEISRAVNYSIEKRFVNRQVTINNNYKKKNVNMSLLNTCDYILDQKPILSATGVLFKRHANSINLLYDVIENFVQSRDKYKNTMFKYPKGTEQFQFYNLQQLLAKRDVNALYGSMGQYSCLLYNIYVAESTTTQGRSCISASILFFESFLSNNVKFENLNEIITFINNVLSEKPNRVYRDRDILDRDITAAECFTKIMRTCGFNGYIPSESDMDIVWNIIQGLPGEDINRLYYKNNIYDFFDNKNIRNGLIYILSLLDEPFLNPNKVPETIKIEMDEMFNLIKEYVYYGYQYIDRLGRAETMERNICIIIDTDSTIISLDAWYHFVLNLVADRDLKIKENYYDKDSFINNQSDHIMKTRKADKEKINTWDFYNEEFVTIERDNNEKELIPQDSLRYSIINIMASFCGRFIIDYMKEYTKNSNSYDDNRKCLLIQKNEFLFKRASVSEGKKHYADLQEIQEGNMVPKDKQMAIMGLELMKSGLAKQTQKDLKQILHDDVLDCGKIDQIKVVQELIQVEKKIITSLQNGETYYLKPSTIKAISNYDDPMRIQGITASIAYNTLKYDYMEGIDLNTRNGIFIIKVDINKKNRDQLKDIDINIYNKLLELMSMKTYENGVKSIALPYNTEMPKWIKNFIDYKEILADNLKPFPIETIGIQRMDKKNITYTNILKL